MYIEDTPYKYSVTNEFVIPQRSYRKQIAKSQSKIKHMLFAIAIVAILIGLGILYK